MPDATAEIPLIAAGGAPHLAEVAQAQTTLQVTDATAGEGFNLTGSGSTAAEEGGWTLRHNEPMVSAFSGGASFNYPISLPPGRNGLQPAVSLSYNSKRVDGIINWQASEWVGLGWNIDSMDIVRTGVREMWLGNSDFWLNYNNEFQLVMNGASYRLNPANGAQLHGRYTAEDAPGLHIMRINDCSDDNNCFNNSGGSRVNRTTEYWLVKTPDGATFRLGHNANADCP